MKFRLFSVRRWSLYLMKSCAVKGDADLQDRAGLVLSVGQENYTQFFFNFSWAGLDLGFGNKPINLLFFFSTETVRPFKEEIQESSSKTQELQESNERQINVMVTTWPEACCITIVEVHRTV